MSYIYINISNPFNSSNDLHQWFTEEKSALSFLLSLIDLNLSPLIQIRINSIKPTNSNHSDWNYLKPNIQYYHLKRSSETFNNLRTIINWAPKTISTLKEKLLQIIPLWMYLHVEGLDKSHMKMAMSKSILEGLKKQD